MTPIERAALALQEYDGPDTAFMHADFYMRSGAGRHPGVYQ